ncbi:Pleckstrin homology domain superfamily protein [Klebsormidium nitens]|uniref:Pleckstrin homology domain superfamily protein n=1 Tax=Klebsormidium nitens TaxID=105231 RepID=A0A1Y1HUH1_KLENI|nr:Pleckstrin homology domain superfamily protein [Klebsormidium nitens]|eukprot:GAQ79498.1 Pleckstrin homology domain superfamily protein [Klebsormidium nitens]
MAGGKRKAEEELDRGDGYKNGVRDAEVPSTGPKAPDSSRKADCLTTVTALNTQFASWIQKQQQDRPFDLWRTGAQDYLRHAEKILSDFHDVVDWISSTSGQNGSTTETAEQPEVSKAPETKTPPADAPAFKGWGKFENENGKKPAANGASQEQGKAFAWAPAGKSGDLSASHKPGDWGGVFPGLAFGKKDEGFGGFTAGEKSKTDTGGSALPGWGSGFNTSSKGEKEAEGMEVGFKAGDKRSAFKFPMGGASEGPKTAPTFTTSLFGQPASTPGTSAAVAPSPLFTVPPFQPSSLSAPPTTGGKSASGETPKTGPQTAPVFSVPKFPSLVQAALVPAIKTSVTPGAFDWAAGFKNPVPKSGAAPSFALPGAKALAGGAEEEGKKEGAEKEKKGEEEAGEGEAPSEPPSPSFKAAEEEGVENVFDTPIKVYKKGPGPDGKWEDQGTGSLMLKRDKGAALKSKEANARIVFRNPGGKVLLNARLYVGMKLELGKDVVNTILQTTETSTPTKGGDAEKPAETVTEVVTRLYAFKRPKQGGMASEELKAALERQVPSEDASNAKS